jgi:lipoprotein signal peptidase
VDTISYYPTVEAVAVAAPSAAPREVERRPALTVLSLLALVLVLDQATKWWAWRHIGDVSINDGGDPLVGPAVSRLYANPMMGALLDLLDAGLLIKAVAMLVRGRQMTLVRLSATLVAAGWMSNLVDRLGMHYVTAPGSVRGAVDFIHIGRDYLNVADFFIIAGTVLFLLTSACQWIDRKWLSTEGKTMATPHRPRVWMRVLAVAGGIGIIAVVAQGAAHYGGVTAPAESTSVSATP